MMSSIRRSFPTAFSRNFIRRSIWPDDQPQIRLARRREGVDDLLERLPLAEQSRVIVKGHALVITVGVTPKYSGWTP